MKLARRLVAVESLPVATRGRMRLVVVVQLRLIVVVRWLVVAVVPWPVVRGPAVRGPVVRGPVVRGPVVRGPVVVVVPWLPVARAQLRLLVSLC